MYPFDLKNAGATHAEMLPLKNNDAGECVCLLWCDDKSRVAKAAPSLFFLSFGTQLSFFFLFSFLQCFWPCPFFFLQGPMLSWKSYNLNRFAKPTRCHPFKLFLQQPGVISCIVVILFCNTWVNTAQKMIMKKKLIRKFFIEAATCTAAKGREESFKRGETRVRRIHGMFLLSSRLQPRVLVLFFQVLLTWLSPLKLNTFFCSLQ